MKRQRRVARESNLARVRRLVAEEPSCDCGSPTIVSRTIEGRIERYCLNCLSPITPFPIHIDDDILALLEVV